jgi:BioD-like phosphotransacetylase family protein
MEDLNKYTKIELQKMGNDIKARHDVLKQEIITDTYEMEELEKRINKKVLELEELEKNYVEIVEKLVE